MEAAKAEHYSSAGLEAAKAAAATRQLIPYAQYEYVDVVFNAVADTDTDIKHSLSPPTPEDIDYQVVNWEYDAAPTAAPVVYRDSSATRRPWGAGYIVLRCNEDAVRATLLLTVRPERSLS
ncbi:MAG TPA: hypothetical protein VEA69_02840 [Tepidisphaeraceae bacterium]|nr:hypothetical protein [Tepidisphaeraceae bacterium]